MKSTDTTSDLTRFTGTRALDPERTSVTFRTKAMWALPAEEGRMGTYTDAFTVE